jgi:hypothetical protein
MLLVTLCVVGIMLVMEVSVKSVDVVVVVRQTNWAKNAKLQPSILTLFLQPVPSILSRTAVPEAQTDVLTESDDGHCAGL